MIREAHEETNVTSDLWLYVATLYFTECELHVFAVSGLEYYQAISMTDEKIQKLRIKDLGITTIKPIEKCSIIDNFS